MAFNSNSYYANKYRKEAWDNLAKARELKARIARGEAKQWELDRVPFFVAIARSNMKLHRSYRACAEIDKEIKRLNR